MMKIAVICEIVYVIAFLESNHGYLIRTPSRSVEWVADIPGGYYDAANVAMRHQINLLGKVVVGNKRRQWFRFSANLNKNQEREISALLAVDPKINWASKQDNLFRERKSVLPLTKKHGNFFKNLNEKKKHHQDVNCVCKNITVYPEETFGSHVYEVMDRQSDASLSKMFNDPKWPCQWELYNCGQTTGPHRVDLNVVPCWEKGFTGKGVVVTIVDDGLDYVNKDLEDAFDIRASANLNDNKDHGGPMPNKSKFGNDHGTKCGGEIAMRPNNNYCGVGVAYDATLGGIRFLDGVVTDASEAAALVFNADYIDIYSCSWGPQDNGATWEGPGRLASAALEVGSNEGREGLGSVYVWAAGNGGASGDHCGADGYTCSIYTIAIASVSDQGLSTFYTESCSCIMAVTLNGGPHEMSDDISEYRPMHYLVTTDPYEGCVNTFSGTSSAAPLASGIVALVLQANPKLTWRDVQHLIVRNSKIPNPTEDGWNINGAGFHVHHKYGFGLMDAAKLVMAAQSWKNVNEQKKCEVIFPNANRYVKSGETLTLEGHTTACADSANQVNYLEHVQIIMSYTAKCRGDVSIELSSPCGTISELMSTREYDTSKNPVIEWPFMTVHNWGEDPSGIWSVKITDNKGTVSKCDRKKFEKFGIYVSEIRIIFWGTSGNKRSTAKCQNEKNNEWNNVAEKYKLKEGPSKNTAMDSSNIKERLDQKIINSEFIDEHDNDISALNLKNAKAERNLQNLYRTEKSKENEISDLKARLANFLMRNSENEDNQFLKNEVPLARTARKMEN